jgi:NitT/TauT family transport system permease protein
MSRALKRLLGYVGASAVLLAGWWLLAMLVDSPALPGPGPALAAFAEHAGELWPETLVSFARILVAMAVGMVLAVPLGLAVGRSERADTLVAPLLFLTYPVPKIVFLPILLVLFGLGDAPKVALIAIIVFFQIIVTARDAARAVPPGAVLSVRSLGASKLDIARHVIFPSALPEIFTAARIGTGTAIAVLFFAESIAGTNGLGWFIIDAWGLIDYPRMFAGILAMALLGVVFYEALDALEHWATRWRRAGR